ncbi:MAG: response regulator transcription factor [Verrucomicrobia bacterium]|nr:response regulator transcription factor [Verrucomicrobiota bacterium]
MPADPLLEVCIVEDDEKVRNTLVCMLKRAKGFLCVGEYASAEQAIQEIPRLRPDVVLMDISLPAMSGVDCVRELGEKAPAVQIIMLTVHEDAEAIFNSLAAGARGYLLKPVRSADLLAAIKDVNSGGAPMTSTIARKVVQSFKKAGPSSQESENLSPRELEVLTHLAKGYLYKEVADMLNVSYATVHTHIDHIYAKLRVRSRAQAVAKYHHL